MNWYLNRRPKPDGTLRLFGLPFSVTKAQIQAFFEGFEIVKDGIGLLTDHHGRPTGEAFVQFVSPEVARLAAGKHKHLIDGRYVEISFSTLKAANQAIERQMYINMGMVPPDPKSSTRTWTNPYWMKHPLPSGNPSPSPQTHPEFSNTPFTSSFEQSQLGCRPFFSAILEAAGLAYCAPVVEQSWGCQYPALNVNGCNITCTMPAFDNQTSTGASRTQRHIRMRGLPFAATVNDILDFFRPIQPLTVTMRTHKNGKPNGMADVYFATVEDTKEAMKRHKAPMGFRYIELFSSVQES
ncbi:Heteroproteinous nuclear ribonucleoprotein H [Clonorchis sinensis]|uniref:Heteroproteinous nuclear ribonucleoprotein H n=1 Tax=Clonorchis sinensis TaxID=79923 RepID=A0A419PCS8_CLOSI|nr:Heteroproteinous nuclear ribonucleoprotein H [Clonorchis sinensis]